MAAGLHSMTISLDGFAEDHNWLRGHPESHHNALEAIKMLVHEPELTWDVVTCVNRRNYPYLDELKTSLYKIGVRNGGCLLSSRLAVPLRTLSSS